MKIKNNKGEFKLSFDGVEYDIPKGIFKVTDKLGYFIIKKAEQWEYDVKIIEDIKEATIVKEEIEGPVKSEEKEITEEPKAEPVEEKVTGATTSTLPSNQGPMTQA